MHYTNCTLTPSHKVHVFRKIYYCIWNHKQAFWFQHILTQNSIYSPSQKVLQTHTWVLQSKSQASDNLYTCPFSVTSRQRLARWASRHEGSLTPVKGKQNIQMKVVSPRLLLLQNSRFPRRWTSRKVWCSRRSRRTRVVQRHKLAQSCLHWEQLWSYPGFLSLSQLKYRCCALSHVSLWLRGL